MTDQFKDRLNRSQILIGFFLGSIDARPLPQMNAGLRPSRLFFLIRSHAECAFVIPHSSSERRLYLQRHCSLVIGNTNGRLYLKYYHRFVNAPIVIRRET